MKIYENSAFKENDALVINNKKCTLLLDEDMTLKANKVAAKESTMENTSNIDIVLDYSDVCGKSCITILNVEKSVVEIFNDSINTGQLLRIEGKYMLFNGEAYFMLRSIFTADILGRACHHIIKDEFEHPREPVCHIHKPKKAEGGFQVKHFTMKCRIFGLGFPNESADASNSVEDGVELYVSVLGNDYNTPALNVRLKMDMYSEVLDAIYENIHSICILEYKEIVSAGSKINLWLDSVYPIYAICHQDDESETSLTLLYNEDYDAQVEFFEKSTSITHKKDGEQTTFSLDAAYVEWSDIEIYDEAIPSEKICLLTCKEEPEPELPVDSFLRVYFPREKLNLVGFTPTQLYHVFRNASSRLYLTGQFFRDESKKLLPQVFICKTISSFDSSLL